MKELTVKEVKSLVNRIGPHLGCDFTDDPEFPEGRRDICVVKHTAENGDYGFDTIYLVWKDPVGIHYKEIANSRLTKDYIHINSVEIDKDGSISVKFGSGGGYSGVPWNESMKAIIGNSKAEISKKDPESFTEQAKQEMVKVVESHWHSHPLYKPTSIKESVIDEERGIAAFVLFEQIDTDRLSKHGEGWLGDQFRYSLWVMKKDGKPWRIYEDHAYIRPLTKSGLTGTRGRSCKLKNLRIEGNTIQVLHPEGDRVEKQEWKELNLPTTSIATMAIALTI